MPSGLMCLRRTRRTDPTQTVPIRRSPRAGGVGPDVFLLLPELRRSGVQLGECGPRRFVPALRGATRAPRARSRRGTRAGCRARGWNTGRDARNRRGSTMSTERERAAGELSAAISNTVVRALARTTGRGPTKAKTTLGDNGVFVVLQDTLTVGEQTLNAAGEGQAVLDLRRRWQAVMEADVSREIEELMGRKVIGFMSDNHIAPDLAVEVLVLESLAPTDPVR